MNHAYMAQVRSAFVEAPYLTNEVSVQAAALGPACNCQGLFHFRLFAATWHQSHTLREQINNAVGID